MIQLLKLGASFVLPPGIFFLALLFLARLAWLRGERFAAKGIALIVAVFYLLSTYLVADVLMGALEHAYEPPENPAGDVIIMLGGGAFSDVPDVDGEGALTASPSARLLTAVRLARKLDLPILVSGGQVFQESGKEALLAKRTLLSLGVPEDRILVEGESQNTVQNAAYTARILKEHGLERPILVTSAFHMKRSVLNYEKLGIEVVPYPTDYMTNRHPIFHCVKLAPSADALRTNATVLQESLRTTVTYCLGK
ncbi:YdcF family protein [uncultured Selenomonas sp.]|uniref:YdcF family protein n=1 Tax=uncultured Selenomonas sp. TaxID=159275 RepID=UPI0028DD017C|nr:YdcF family protein [uncultured Selenomonas sp.]